MIKMGRPQKGPCVVLGQRSSTYRPADTYISWPRGVATAANFTTTSATRPMLHQAIAGRRGNHCLLHNLYGDWTGEPPLRNPWIGLGHAPGAGSAGLARQSHTIGRAGASARTKGLATHRDRGGLILVQRGLDGPGGPWREWTAGWWAWAAGSDVAGWLGRAAESWFGEYGGCGAGGAELFTSLFILHGRCLTGGRAVYTSSPPPQHASSVNYSRSYL